MIKCLDRRIRRIRRKGLIQHTASGRSLSWQGNHSEKVLGNGSHYSHSCAVTMSLFQTIPDLSLGDGDAHSDEDTPTSMPRGLLPR